MGFNTTKPFWENLGVALIILAICLGIGKCSNYMDFNESKIKMEKEKTRQLEIQLKIEKIRQNKDNDKDSQS